jgi:putative glutamine amidotransferase
MRMRPVIGITSDYEAQADRTPPRERILLIAAYADAVTAAGGIPWPLPVLANPAAEQLDALLCRVDGLLLTGGDDIFPRRYGATRDAATDVMHARRDAFEFALFPQADERRIPTLAICLGFQLAHVARGGALHQHIDDLPRTPPLAHRAAQGASAYHRVRIAPDSRLAAIVEATELEVNSRHHQAVDAGRPGADLQPVAWSPDGLLEASEDQRAGRFFVAVQWHPENLVERTEHLALFQALVAAARGK